MTRNRTLIPRLMLLLALPPACARAQSSWGIQEAVQFALSHRPEVQAAAQMTKSSEDLRLQASLLPNPRLYFQTEDLQASHFNFWQQSETYAYASETFETSGRRAGRIALANQGIERSRISAEQVGRELELRVREAYWAAEAAKMRSGLYAQGNAYFLEIVAYNDARFHEGKLAEIDLLRVRLEAERVHAGAARAELESERAVLTLAREMGATNSSGWNLTEDFAALEPPPDLPAGSDPVLLSTAGRASEQAIAEAHANLKLQQAAGRPDLEALFGYKRNIGSDTAMAGLQLNLPLFDRNQGSIGAAQAQANAARQNYAAVRQQLLSELSLAQRDYAFQSRAYHNTYKPLKEEAVEISNISRAAYKEGGLDLVRLLDEERVRVEAELSWVQALEDYHQSVVRLAYAEGMHQP